MNNIATQRTAVLVVCLAGLWLAVLAAADQKPRLEGRWNFNPAVSGDSAAKLSEAEHGGNGQGTIGSYPTPPGPYPGPYPGVGIDRPIGDSGGARAGDPDGIGRGPQGAPIGGANGGVNYPPGDGGDPGTPGRSGAPTEQGSSGKAGTSPQWGWLTQNPKFLQISQQGKQIVIADDTGQARTYYPDGKKHDGSDAQGNKTSTKARWEGNSLVAGTKIANSGVLTESFRPCDDGNQVYIKTRFESPSLPAPFRIRRVYDPAKAPAK